MGIAFWIFGGLLLLITAILGEKLKGKWKIFVWILFIIFLGLYTYSGIILDIEQKKTNKKFELVQQQFNDKFDNLFAIAMQLLEYAKSSSNIKNSNTLEVVEKKLRLEETKKKANLEVSQRNDFYVGSADDRTKINLLFRNLSDRPTSIVDIYLREKNGGVIRSIGDPDGITMPIKIQPWDIKKISFRVERQEEERMTDILIIDMDDNRIIIPKERGKPWYK